MSAEEFFMHYAHLHEHYLRGEQRLSASMMVLNDPTSGGIKSANCRVNDNKGPDAVSEAINLRGAQALFWREVVKHNARRH